MKPAEFLSRFSKPLWVVAAVVFLAGEGYLDILVGDFSLLIFDLIPIASVTWFAGRGAGYLVAFLCAIKSLIIDSIETPQHSHPLIHFWNLVVVFAFSFFVVHILFSLKKMLLREQEQSRIDYLTGVFNARAFSEALLREADRARRYKHIFSLAYLDIDNFKAVNDRFGHSVGDTLLRAVGQAIKSHIRIVDITARIGGDEFSMLLPETGCDAAQVVFFRLQAILNDLMIKEGWSVTFSIGVVSFMKLSFSADEMIREADQLMYTAKTRGKNSIQYKCIEE